MDTIRLWLSTVLGELAGWINLRAIDPDAKRPPRTDMVRTVEEAAAWCQRHDDQGWNLYAGLARRGEVRDTQGRVDASERNLAGCRVVWADLDSGTREEQITRVAAFPLVPTLLVDSGGGLHPLWQLETPIACASDPESNTQLRHILKGVQVAIGGDSAVVDPSRVFRVAGTMNYPNARKRAQGRVPVRSGILRTSAYSVSLEDFADFELRGAAELHARPSEVAGHGERIPAAIELVLSRVERMRRVFSCEERLKDGDASHEDYAVVWGLLRRAPWLRSEDLEAALRYRRVALAHKVKGAIKAAGYYAATVRKARRELAQKVEAPDFEHSPARWFQWALGRALQPQSLPVVYDEAPEEHVPPRISTSIPEVDQATGGGAYGFTCIAGDSGVGKSTTAWNVALAAKAGGWDVLYIAAEMEQADYEMRAGRFLGCSPGEVRASGRLPVLAHVASGLDLDALIDLVLTAPGEKAQRLLIVLDSITKIAAYIDEAQTDNSFFRAMARLTRMAEAAVRFGERRIAVVATSELNKDRQAIGRRITYAASLEIDLMADKDQPDLVRVSIPKARYSARPAQPFGPYLHDWRRHRLRLIGSATREAREERDEGIL